MGSNFSGLSLKTYFVRLSGANRMWDKQQSVHHDNLIMQQNYKHKEKAKYRALAH